MFLEPSVGDGKNRLRVKFTNVAGINIGTRVTLAGKPVGEVEKILTVPNARDGKTDEFDRIYFYELILRVDSLVKVYNTDEITVQTTGLLGEKSIGIILKAPKKGQIPKLINNQIIYGDSIEPIENAIYQLGQLSDKVEDLVVEFDDWFQENSDEITYAIKSFGDAMKEIDEAVETVNQQKLIPTFKEAAVGFTDNMHELKTTLKEINEKQMVTKVDGILNNVSDISESVNSITDDIAKGKGTIGKLVKGDDLYLRLTAIFSKANTLMNDINNYGLLFQYNKQWQRIRTKRASLIQALNTPKEFRDYFEREVDDINASLGRISMLVEKAENEGEKESIVKSDCFKKDFATLLREIEGLLDTAKLYNEDILEDPCAN